MISTSVRANMLANFLGRIWAFLSIYIFVPFYIKILGIESYGVIGYFAIMQSVMMIADVGMTAALSRELAKLAPLPDSAREMRNLTRTIELFYWSIAIAAGVVNHIFAEYLVTHWVNANGVSVQTLISVFKLIGWSVALQLPATLYQGGLLGLQHQILSNIIQAVWSLVKNGGVIFVIIIYPKLESFFGWTLLCNVLYSVVTGYALFVVLPKIENGKSAEFRLSILKKIAPFAFGMVGMTALSAVFTQADKVFVGGMLSLKEFSFYSLAALISQAPVIVVGPIATAIFPQLTSLLSLGEKHNLRKVYHRACQLVAWVALPLGVVFAYFSQSILLVWTHSPEVAAGAGPILFWFAIGSTALALAVVPYQLALANGYVRLNVLLSIAGIIVFIPILMILVKKFGAEGGGIAWAIVNLSSLLAFVMLLHRRFLPGASRAWLLRDVGIPLGIYLVAVTTLKVSLPQSASPLFTLAVVGFGMALAACVVGYVTPGISEFLFQKNK